MTYLYKSDHLNECLMFCNNTIKQYEVNSRMRKVFQLQKNGFNLKHLKNFHLDLS